MILKNIKKVGLPFLLIVLSGSIFAAKPVVGIGEITSNVEEILNLFKLCWRLRFLKLINLN